MRDFTPWPDELAESYRAAGYWTGETFPGFLDRIVKEHGDSVAAVGGSGARLSYHELRERALRAAAGLSARGISQGDRVVVQLPNTPEFVIACFALFHLGALPVFSLPSHREAEIGAFCALTGAAGYLHADGPDYERLSAHVSSRVPVRLSLSEFAALDGELSPPAGVRADEVALLQLSGGSTGTPKLIPRTHDDYLYSVRASAGICDLGPSTVYLCVLPAAHNFPLSSPGVLGVLHAGGRVVFCPDPSPSTAFGAIEAERVTMTALVPPLARVWLDAAQHTSANLSSLDVLQVGGARLDKALARRVRPELGASLQQVFGMAEGLVCYTRAGDPEDVVATAQVEPISPADEIRVVDDEDHPVADGAEGHLLTRGPYTIRGYYRADDHNATAFTPDGFYRTGDIVRRTPAGRLVVTGRAKDQINRGGEKIATAEIESHLRAHPKIREAAVVAAPDPILGERSCAFCVPLDDSLTGAGVRRFLRGRGLAAYKIPDLVRFVPELPRTAVGKIDTTSLKEASAR